MSNALKKLAGKVLSSPVDRAASAPPSPRALADDGADVAISYVGHRPTRLRSQVVRELAGQGRPRRGLPGPTRPGPAQVAGLVRKMVAERFGHLDILVNNAGVFVTGPVP